MGFLPFGWWPYADFDAIDDVANDGLAAPAAPVPASPARPSAPPSLIQPVLTLARPQAIAQSDRGKLVIDVTPMTAQVIVDGFYVGTVEEVARLGSGLDVAAGWHRLEFRAPGFETPAINVTIEAGRTMNYRGELKPLNR